MGKMVSISGIIHKLKDIKATADFYKGLGFLVNKKEAGLFDIHLNWFWVDFIEAEPTGIPSGEFLYVSVDSVDDINSDLMSNRADRISLGST